ncbi:MAG: MotA/TolQ/ExbB proton channel family protein [Porticoccus sp.]|nr:MotA/TolQ/ExbB proton channel family protein [Porticoccus sp.]
MKYLCLLCQWSNFSSATKYWLVSLILVASGIYAVDVSATEDAATLDELLRMIKSASVNESKEHRAREAEFNNAKTQQSQKLKDIRAIKAAEERHSEQLEKVYAGNELKLAALQEQLEKRLGTLGEMFGHLTAAAGDTRETLNQSIVSAQYPGRTEFLDELITKMNSNTKLPSMEEIEGLWYEINREMIEGGKVIQFPSTVTKVDGTQVQQDVVRIGVFNLLSDGAYLAFNPSTGIIAELPRQPERQYLRAAVELQQASEGFSSVGIDPTGPSGGSLLSALINSPSLMERWHQGGLIGYFITLVGAGALLLALWRFVVLMGVSRRVNHQLTVGVANTNNPLGRVLSVGEENSAMDAESLELKLHEQVLKERPAIELGLSLLKIIAMVAPLLGLLGTVTGMIVTFQAITVYGAGDPKAMAGGISAALVTTVLGLCVAIPVVLLHTMVNGKAQRVLHILEEQSAGIIAEKVAG